MEHSVPSPEKSIRTVIADDSAAMRGALREILERHGYRVVGEADNGLEAIRLCKEQQPELVTLDIIMPRMDGIQALRIIRSTFPLAPVVMVSAMTSMNKVVECAKFGAQHYIVKPFEEEKVVDVLRKLFPERTV